MQTILKPQYEPCQNCQTGGKDHSAPATGPIAKVTYVPKSIAPTMPAKRTLESRLQATRPLSHSQLQDFTKINLRSLIESKSKYRDISDIELRSSSNSTNALFVYPPFTLLGSLRKSFEKWKASLQYIYQCALSVWSCAPALVTSWLHKGKLFLKSSQPKDSNPKAGTSRTKIHKLAN